MPVPRGSARKPACLRDRRAWLVLLRRLPAGGTIYDLAALLYGYDARGEDFQRLRVELRRLFGLEAAR
jgi:hypothetical protein